MHLPIECQRVHDPADILHDNDLKNGDVPRGWINLNLDGLCPKAICCRVVSVARLRIGPGNIDVVSIFDTEGSFEVGPS